MKQQDGQLQRVRELLGGAGSTNSRQDKAGLPQQQLLKALGLSDAAAGS